MIRSSALNEAELCGQVQVLSKQFPRTYRNTLLGHAFHARAAAMPDAAAALERLTPDERADVEAWRVPESIGDESVLLTYEMATKEQLVGLDVNGCWCDVLVSEQGEYIETPGLLVPARPDMYWVRDHPRGKTVSVGDIKTGEHPIPGGPLSLQFIAPALALADKHGADWIRTGIWWARDGRWEWGPPIAVTSELAVELWQRIRRAATNPPTPVVGGHCSGCFQRQFCPAHMLPATQLETDLAPLVKPGGLTPANIVRAHLYASALDKLAGLAKDAIKAALREMGPVDAGGGKVLTVDMRAGRESADVAVLKEHGLGDYVKRGRAYPVVTVRKA